MASSLARSGARRLWPLGVLLKMLSAAALVNYRTPVLIDKPQGSKVLVLSPHPDDDVIGCGGTLHKHRLAGDDVTVVYLTDGCKGAQAPTGLDDLPLRRRKEAEAAAKVIGISNLVFWDNKDGELTRGDRTVAQMSRLLDEVQPDTVYLPSFLDNHPDHFAANEIFIASCKSAKSRIQCYAYEVWTPIMPNQLVDISDHMDLKIEAINQHRSQVTDIDYGEKTKGLNAYRSITAPHCSYAEAFFASPAKEYAWLFKLRMLG